MTAPVLPLQNRSPTESIHIATLATSPGAPTASGATAPGSTEAGSEARSEAGPATIAGGPARPASGLLEPEVGGGNAWADSLRPAAMIVGLLFIPFLIYNALAFPPGARGPVCLHDIAMIALGFGLYAACRRRPTLSLLAVHVGATVLSFGVLSNILLAAMLGVNPLFSHYVSVLIIASAGSVMLARWAIAIALVEVGAWAAVAHHLLSGTEFRLHALVVFSTLAVAAIVQVGRVRARARIQELRAGDARREQALQQALAEADEARRGLDRKVEDRTAALRSELEERTRLEEQLRHAQKLEAVGRLAGGIAHDFNNLLTVIRMSLVTVGGAPLCDEMRDALRDASDATDRAAGLTHDLLAFARKQTLQRAQIAVADVLGGVERMVRRVAEASIRLEVRAAPEAGEVVADRHQIEQVLLNLAINACDAMGNRGTLTIAADAVEIAGAEAARRRVHAGQWVRIAVTDTGTGMDEATRRSVFEPFFTTKEVGRGTGLGLAVAHGIVTQHGGQIEVESELGVGSTFTVLLPRARGASPRSAVAVAQPVAAQANETVLVVEDEAAVRRAVQRNLERLGSRVVAAQDGEDALRRAEELDGVDLLLTDVVMPGIDGPTLACQLREKWPGLPVLFVTGYSADRLERTGAVGPHDRVLEKPYQLADLTRTIRQMLERGGAVAVAG
ncbi:MAG TPA: ATP-binding protein [Kofleriaceae bacterium]|nr:ATP-binding protein [Kofleriaceae bacterium]